MPPALNRRWFRFSLRSMLVALTVVAVWLGGMSMSCSSVKLPSNRWSIHVEWHYLPTRWYGGTRNSQ